jgi:hypothetical protein
VVVGIDAPYRTNRVVFQDGRVIERRPENNLKLFDGEEVYRLSAKLVQVWSGDLSFALNRLERLNASDPSGKFAGRLDMRRVGAFGHSIGGATAVQFCHDDSRSKACIDVDGIPLGSAVQEGVTQPVMFLLSDHKLDALVDSAADRRPVAANFGSIFERLRSDRWMEIMMRGANHYMFSDDAILRNPLMMRALQATRIVGITGRRQLAVTAHFVEAFFDVHLNGAAAPALKDRGEYPEVEYVH